MKKAFKFTMEFEAVIRETLEDPGQTKPHRLKELFSHFLRDNRAVLDLYKLWLLGDLRIDEHHDAIGRHIEARHEDHILVDILGRCGQKTRQYYIEGLNQKDERKLRELEDLFGQFGLLALAGARFEEIALPEEHTRETV